MTIGVVRAVDRPLHDLVDRWKQDTPEAAVDHHEADCLCGGTIRVDVLTERSIGRAVQRHNETVEHTAWAIRNGWRHSRVDTDVAARQMRDTLLDRDRRG